MPISLLLKADSISKYGRLVTRNFTLVLCVDGEPWLQSLLKSFSFCIKRCLSSFRHSSRPSRMQMTLSSRETLVVWSRSCQSASRSEDELSPCIEWARVPWVKNRCSSCENSWCKRAQSAAVAFCCCSLDLGEKKHSVVDDPIAVVLLNRAFESTDFPHFGSAVSQRRPSWESFSHSRYRSSLKNHSHVPRTGSGISSLNNG